MTRTVAIEFMASIDFSAPLPAAFIALIARAIVLTGAGELACSTITATVQREIITVVDRHTSRSIACVPAVTKASALTRPSHKARSIFMAVAYIQRFFAFVDGNTHDAVSAVTPVARALSG